MQQDVHTMRIPTTHGTNRRRDERSDTMSRRDGEKRDEQGVTGRRRTNSRPSLSCLVSCVRSETPLLIFCRYAGIGSEPTCTCFPRKRMHYSNLCTCTIRIIRTISVVPLIPQMAPGFRDHPRGVTSSTLAQHQYAPLPVLPPRNAPLGLTRGGIH